MSIYSMIADFAIKLSKGVENFVGYADIYKKQRESICLPEGFTVTAHAGALNTQPNTVRSLKAAIDSGVDIIEIDLSFRPDGVPVMIHKERPTAAQGVFFSNGLAQAAMHKSVGINIDLKCFDADFLPVVQSMLEGFSLSERAFFTGVEFKSLNAVKACCPNIRYYINCKFDSKKNNREYLEELAARVRDCGALGINIPYSSSSRLLCEIFHSFGLKVSVWTVNKKPLMLTILSHSPDNITTKKPQLLLDLIAK